MAVKPIPEGYHTVTPYLIIKDANKALEFYKKALNAKETYRMPGPNGFIAHAEFKVGDSVLMIADETPEMQYSSPSSLGGSPVTFMVYLNNVDEAFKKVIDAGGEIIRPLENQFYGDRVGTFKDPFGYVWNLATHVEDVTPEEVDRRFKEMGTQNQM